MVDDIAKANSDSDTVSRKRKRTPARNNSSCTDNVIGNGSGASKSTGAELLVAQKGRKLKQYVLEEKLDIIDYAKIIGNRAAGREFNVAESSIREWRKNEQRLRSMFATAPERSRLDGGGRRPVSEDLEKGLLQYVTSRSDGETALTWHDIKEKANELWKDICERNPEYNDRGFNANMGWVARFVRRNNITLQVTNSASTIVPKLVTSSNNSCNSSTVIDDLVAQTDDQFISSNTPKFLANSDAVAESASSLTSSSVDTNVVACSSDIATTIATTTAASTVTTAHTTLTSSNTVTTKKRRKNFVPKKVVVNDVLCSTTSSGAPETTVTDGAL